MTSRTNSKQQILEKLLNTLLRYQAELIAIPAGKKARIFRRNKWTEINTCPKLTVEEIITEAEKTFGPTISEDLLRGKHALFDFKNRNFFLLLTENTEGGIFTIELLKELPKKTAWPSQVFDWIRVGGFLEVHDMEIYISILQELAKEKSNIIVSLERAIKYRILEPKGLVHQKELDLHFSTLREGLKEAGDLHANIIGIAEIALTDREKILIKELSRFYRLILLSEPQQAK
ncbi:MAG: hypothetical protein WC897_02145 [Candidatus Gracilibacteria bacterium]